LAETAGLCEESPHFAGLMKIVAWESCFTEEWLEKRCVAGLEGIGR